MPTYEYECLKCGRIFEEFQSISADPLTTCRFDGCDGEVRRLLSGGAGFLFKGSGFYITDYRSDSYKKAEKAEKGDKSDKGSSSEKKSSESKPSSSDSSSSSSSSSSGGSSSGSSKSSE